MNRSFVFLVSVLMVLVVSSFDSHLLAQTVSQEVQPRFEEGRPRRPTLKRRQPAPDTPNITEAKNNQTVELRTICPPKATDAIDEPNDPSETAVPLNQFQVQFEGQHDFDESDLLKMIRERSAFPKDHMPNSEEIDKGIAILKELFQDRGYDDAKFDVVKDEKLHTITTLVNEGVRLPIAQIRFEGNRVFSSEQLTAQIEECLVDHHEASRNGYDREIFEFCQHRATHFVRSQGYLQAKLEEPKRTTTSNGLVLTIHMKEGLLYRFGDMRIEGAEALSANEIRSRIGLQRGDVANGEKLSKALFEDIKKLYWEMGFIQYTAELNPTFADNPEEENEGIVHLEVTIDEGKRFKLHSVKFEGTNLPDEELRNLFLMRKGDIFNQRLFEDSITKLNDTGLFWFIDKDKDSDFKVDDEAATISVVIKLQRREY